MIVVCQSLILVSNGTHKPVDSVMTDKRSKTQLGKQIQSKKRLMISMFGIQEDSLGFGKGIRITKSRRQGEKLNWVKNTRKRPECSQEN